MNQASKKQLIGKKSALLLPSLPWEAELSSLPSRAGVYWFLNQNNKVIYVGKAKNLKSRVTSYKRFSGQTKKTIQLIKSIHKLKFKELDTEIDAIIVEAELIKIHQPKFNILSKDDKSPTYIYITNDEYPKIKIGRSNQIPTKVIKSNIFGPFSSAYTAKKVLKFARNIFPYCDGTDKQIKNQKACFYYHLNLCPGICTGEISKEDYKKNINQIRYFLRGKKRIVISQLKNDINKHIKNKNFELAGKIKSQIETLTLKSTFKNIEKNLPTLNQDEVQEALIKIRKLLRKFFSIPAKYPLTRIEGYDISNIQGKQSTGSMVVFTNGIKDTSEYKRFKIKTKSTPDDPAMIGEVISRRNNHPEWGIPNLILIDGGKTQLSSALKNMTWNIPVISLVKNPDRILIKIEDKYYQIPLGTDMASNIFKQIRDESHRFAKNYHKHLRNKSIIQG